jgi:hypothetical protein
MNALEIELLILQQQEEFGVNMLDYLTIEDDPKIEALIINRGLSEREAMFHVFYKKVRKLTPNKNTSSPTINNNINNNNAKVNVVSMINNNTDVANIEEDGDDNNNDDNECNEVDSVGSPRLDSSLSVISDLTTSTFNTFFITKNNNCFNVFFIILFCLIIAFFYTNVNVLSYIYMRALILFAKYLNFLLFLLLGYDTNSYQQFNFQPSTTTTTSSTVSTTTSVATATIAISFCFFLLPISTTATTSQYSTTIISCISY